MSRYIHQGSFGPAPERVYPDGRNRCDRELKKIFARGPQRPDSLAKRARDDADINSENAMLLTKQERRLRSNAHEALDEIKTVHASGRRPGLPEHEAQGEPEFRSRSVTAVRKAQADAVHVDGHRMLSARELNKAFADSVGRVEVDLDGITSHRGYATEFRAMTKLEKRAFRKGLAQPRRSDIGVTADYGRNGPNSDNANWNDLYAATGAANNFRDIPTPSVRPTLVGGQPIGTPSASNRDAALEAIKQDLARSGKRF